MALKLFEFEKQFIFCSFFIKSTKNTNYKLSLKAVKKTKQTALNARKHTNAYFFEKFQLEL